VRSPSNGYTQRDIGRSARRRGRRMPGRTPAAPAGSRRRSRVLAPGPWPSGLTPLRDCARPGQADSGCGIGLAAVSLARQLRHLAIPGPSRVNRRSTAGTCQVRSKSPAVAAQAGWTARHGRREVGARVATSGRQPVGGTAIRASRGRADRTRRGAVTATTPGSWLAWLPQSSSSSRRVDAAAGQRSHSGPRGQPTDGGASSCPGSQALTGVRQAAPCAWRT
jgi:hypothetical protein